MNRKAMLFSCLAGFLLAAVFISMARAARESTLSNLATGALPGQEMALNPAGGAFEVHLEDQGKLVLSDYFGDEIWRIDPAGQVYTAYHSIPAPSDGRADNAGAVWWADGLNNRLGRLTLETLAVDYWEIPGAFFLYSTGIDAAGRVWVSDYNQDHFYRFEVGASQVCTYTLPGISASDYLLVQGGDLWFGDLNGNRIYRLDTTSDQYTYWALPFGIYPEGMAVDGVGSLWWTDISLNELVHLEPAVNMAYRHAPPIASDPALLTTASDQVWYTDWDGRLGVFNGNTGAGVGEAAERFSGSATPDCSAVEVVESQTVTSTTGSIDWSTSSYPDLYNSAAWSIFELPVDNFPWGIQASEGFVYFADSGRQVLARVQSTLNVIACKLSDSDGDANTTGDRTPVEDWPVYLTVDGVRQEPGQRTEADGCYTWSDLEPGGSYGVQEDLLPGWTALGETSHDFGVSLLGNVYSHTFVNVAPLQVSACKLSDADGDLNTTGDQAPVEGWTVYLTMDGVRQEPGQMTEADGCYTWSDLAAGPDYGVEEELVSGWTALTPTSHEFAPSSPGGTYAYDFINQQESEEGERVYLPLIQR